LPMLLTAVAAILCTKCSSTKTWQWQCRVAYQRFTLRGECFTCVVSYCEICHHPQQGKLAAQHSTYMMPQRLPCLCQPAITGMAGGGTQVCGGDAAHTRTQACCRASLMVVKGDREVRDTTRVPSPQGCRLLRTGGLTTRPPRILHHTPMGVHVGNIQATCEHTCMHTCNKACRAHAHALYSPCTIPAVGQKPRELMFDSNRVHVYYNTVTLCLLCVLGSRFFPQRCMVCLFFFVEVCFDSMPTQHCCFCVVRLCSTWCMCHVVQSGLALPLPQLPSRGQCGVV
jgi:hypothetical protein